MSDFARSAHVRRFLELFALCGIVIAQPVFDLLQKNASLFIAWRTTTGELVAFTLITILVPPLALWCIEWLIGLASDAVARVVHLAFVGVLLLELAIAIVKKATDFGPVTIVASGVALAIGAGIAFARFENVRVWVRYLAVAPVAFAVLFVGFSPATSVTVHGSAPLAKVDVGSPSRVVLLTLDELPLTSLLDGTGHVDAELFPNLAKLTGESTWYRNSTTVSPFTDTAVPAILTGRYPKSETAVPYISEYPQNLFTLLGRTYKLNVHESVTGLCGTDVCANRGRSISSSHGIGGMVSDAATIWRSFVSPNRNPSFDLNPLHGTDAAALETGGDFLTSLQPRAKPTLDYLHVLLPHFPWHYLGSGQDYASLPGHTLALQDQKWASSWAGELARQRHLLQLQAADTFLGLIFDRLRAIDAYDNALIVVTADHGASFAGNQPFRGVANSTYPNILWTPLIVKAPQQTRGRIDDRAARSIDVVPTIADYLDITLPWHVDGRSLLTSKGDEPPRLLKWERNAMQPARGERYLTFDGQKGFKEVLRARAAEASDEKKLRLYRIGPFGSLIGRSAQQWIGEPAAGIKGTLDAAAWYRRIDPNAAKIPWADLHGRVDLPPNRWVAVTVNGVVAAVTQTWGDPGATRTEFWGVLPPALFHWGANDVRLYTVEGAPPNPELDEIRLGG